MDRIEQLANPPDQVLRWSALAVGVFYGFSHQRGITATQRAQHEEHEYSKKQKLIDQAKLEYAKQKNPAPASKDDGTLRHYLPLDSHTGYRARWLPFPVANFVPLVITDASDPKFDLEKLLLKVASENP